MEERHIRNKFWIALLLLVLFLGVLLSVIFVKKGFPNKLDSAQESIFTTQETIDFPTEWYENLLPKNKENIQQWAILNNGTFSQFYNDYLCWGADETRAVAGIDIGQIEIADQNRSVTISMIDTEVDLSHYAIQNSLIWKNPCEIDGDNIDNDNNGFIDDIYGWNFRDANNQSYIAKPNYGIHGTHSAGILIAEDEKIGFSGLLTNANISLMCLKALDGLQDKGRISDVIAAIQYAEQNGAKICCMALRTFKTDEKLREVMQNSKMLFIVAAGNDGINIDETPVYPASFKLPNMIIVADLRCDGNLSKTSNFGAETVDIAAPGTDIVSTIPGGGYRYLSGTSCAVPFVAAQAVFAYICAENEITAAEIKEKVIISARSFQLLG